MISSNPSIAEAHKYLFSIHFLCLPIYYVNNMSAQQPAGANAEFKLEDPFKNMPKLIPTDRFYMNEAQSVINKIVYLKQTHLLQELSELHSRMQGGSTITRDNIDNILVSHRMLREAQQLYEFRDLDFLLAEQIKKDSDAKKVAQFKRLD